MGQVLASIQDRFHGKEWKERQIRKISDKVFDRIKDDLGQRSLAFEDLYIAVLIVYNDINKYLPGPHNDPPSKEKLKLMMQKYDWNLDGELDREEFAEFIQSLTADTVTAVGRNLIIALVIAPALALAAKRATEGVPGVGKAMKKVPNSIYASIVTLAVILFQKDGEDSEAYD
ncbi:uncharacterized protein LOC110021791 [Phalaenopsis equestris]|uniref:uncharacterized protein LOC110021791 n=1 Tax=Phalaenopsis equestris TaxID=78828 RepID=UPI0009E2C8C6|nr:uncharacterized protein LOC110021791 [Phalaenopsis equestris]